ncbi:MAG: bifunctional pyr operon transcriptional regulator/uracil phosphoribosyltransferase PyrR [Actinomycetales bacterium]|nr:bifunctional pyr operon transcriptional regulator/uracil phosphoribosyltransferase PyrR [Actinomycetales bacterium]
MASRTVLTGDDIDRAITRIAHEIVESNHGTKNLILLGIPTRGVLLAERIAKVIQRHYPEFSASASVGRLDITMYRDDLSLHPNRPVTETNIPAAGIDGAVVVLVDDVLYSGRTIRASLDALNAHGRPSVVRLAVLVDRGHRELPIRADFVGKNLPTSREERIRVQMSENDGENCVVIES